MMLDAYESETFGYVVKETDSEAVITIQLKKPITPRDAVNITNTLPDVYGKLVKISGRMPIWLACMMLHKYVHTATAVAFFDPKLRGYVIVATHNSNYMEGDVIG